MGIAISLAVSALAFGTLAACSLPTGVESGNILTEKLPADVTPDGVLLAAVILSSGDIAAAVTQGIVSSAEVNERHLGLTSSIRCCAETMLGAGCLWL